MTSQDVSVKLSPRLVIAKVDEALAFYEKTMGAKILERFEDDRGVVVHAAIEIAGAVLSMTQAVDDWGLSAPAAAKGKGGSPVLLHLTVSDPDGAAARMVEQGAEILIPIEDRHYGKREGRIRDPFGHLWILSCLIEDLTSEEIQRRLAGGRGS